MMIPGWPVTFLRAFWFVSWLLWQYWKTVAWHLQMCRCFTMLFYSGERIEDHGPLVKVTDPTRSQPKRISWEIYSPCDVARGIAKERTIWYKMCIVIRKRVFGDKRTTKTKISLRTRVVWSGPSLANRNSEYKMFDWRAKAGRYFAHAQNYLNLCILRMLESTFSLDAAHMRELKKKKKRRFYNIIGEPRDTWESPLNAWDKGWIIYKGSSGHMTFIQRRINVDATSCDVVSALRTRWGNERKTNTREKIAAEVPSSGRST